jgi:hypothetical protein
VARGDEGFGKGSGNGTSAPLPIKDFPAKLKLIDHMAQICLKKNGILRLHDVNGEESYLSFDAGKANDANVKSAMKMQTKV